MTMNDIEYVEHYRPGGFHPIAIDDVFAQGCYRIVHKWGFRGSLTIWLARNQTGKLVTLNVMHAEMSSKPVDNLQDSEFIVLRKLVEYIQSQGTITSPEFENRTIGELPVVKPPPESNSKVLYV